MIGTWTGTYRHLSKRIPEERRNMSTGFKMMITEFDGENFAGTIEDDLETGGTKGIGTVTGTILNSKVSFVKQMPVLTFLNSEGRNEMEDKPHRKVYYSGMLEGNTIHGGWRFKFGLGSIKKTMTLFLPTKGSWEMTKMEV